VIACHSGLNTANGQNAARVDLADKVFGAPIFVHDMKLDGMPLFPPGYDE